MVLGPNDKAVTAVVFDVDDFCDKWNCMPSLFRLKQQYPNFKCSLFTIVDRIDKTLLADLAKSYGNWLEFCVHGFIHEPNDELLYYSYEDLVSKLSAIDYGIYKKVLRPPGWHINETVVQTCNQVGLGVAIHKKDIALMNLIKHGSYIVESYNNWHGHTHDVCGNWIDQKLPELLTKWPTDQEFQFVSDSLYIDQLAAYR